MKRAPDEKTYQPGLGVQGYIVDGEGAFLFDHHFV